MKRWLAFVLFVVVVISAAIAAGVSFELGFPTVLGAGYAGGAAAFFGYVFMTGPSVQRRLSSVSPVRVAAMPTVLMFLVALGLPFALVLLMGSVDPTALQGVLTIDTAMVALPLTLLTSMRSSVAHGMPWPVIALSIGCAALPIIYVGALLYVRRRTAV